MRVMHAQILSSSGAGAPRACICLIQLSHILYSLVKCALRFFAAGKEGRS